LDKGVGSPQSMLDESTKSLKSLGQSIGSKVASHTETVNGSDLLQQVADKFKNSGMSADDMGQEIKKLAKLQSGIVNKLQNGEDVSMSDLHTLYSNVGKNTYKTFLDDPAMKANKEIGNEFYHAASGILKKNVPEAVPDIENYTKELKLNTGLQKAVNKASKSKLTLNDLMAIAGGFGVHGILGGAVAYGTEKAVTSPTVGLKTAGLLSGLASPTAQGIGAKLSPLIVRGASKIGGLVSPSK